MNLVPLTNMATRIAVAQGTRGGLRGADLEDFTQDILVEAIGSVQRGVMQPEAMELPGYLQSLAVSRLLDRRRKTTFRSGCAVQVTARQRELATASYDQQEHEAELIQHRDSVCLVRRKLSLQHDRTEAITMAKTMHQTQTDPNTMVSLSAVAIYMGISRPTLTAMLQEPGAPMAIRLRRQYRYRIGDIKQWISQRKDRKASAAHA